MQHYCTDLCAVQAPSLIQLMKDAIQSLTIMRVSSSRSTRFNQRYRLAHADRVRQCSMYKSGLGISPHREDSHKFVIESKACNSPSCWLIIFFFLYAWKTAIAVLLQVEVQKALDRLAICRQMQIYESIIMIPHPVKDLVYRIEWMMEE